MEQVDHAGDDRDKFSVCCVLGEAWIFAGAFSTVMDVSWRRKRAGIRVLPDFSGTGEES